VIPVTTIAEITGAAAPTVCNAMRSGEPRSDRKVEPSSYSTASGTQNIQPRAKTSSR
jgi:hypothetical protein